MLGLVISLLTLLSRRARSPRLLESVLMLGLVAVVEDLEEQEDQDLECPEDPECQEDQDLKCQEVQACQEVAWDLDVSVSLEMGTATEVEDQGCLEDQDLGCLEDQDLVDPPLHFPQEDLDLALVDLQQYSHLVQALVDPPPSFPLEVRDQAQA